MQKTLIKRVLHQ